MKTLQNLITLIGVLVSLACGSRTAEAREYVTIKLPFAMDGTHDPHLCTQGTNDPTGSHMPDGIDAYALDFDTPDDGVNKNSAPHETIYAPISGMAYVHDTGVAGYGKHINIDLGTGPDDPTFILLAHLQTISISSEVEVVQGQPIAIEGATGNVIGRDIVHIARMAGDPRLQAGRARSIPELKIIAKDPFASDFGPYGVDQFDAGTLYESNNKPPCNAPDDVNCDSQYTPDVVESVQRELIDTSGSCFPLEVCSRPQDRITRAEICKAAMKAFGIDEDPTATEPFTDVPSSHTLRPYVATLYQRGVISGCNPPTNTLFCPDNYVTWAEAAKIMINTLKLRDDVEETDIPVQPHTTCPTTPTCDTDSFQDVTQSHSLCEYVETAKRMGFADGYGNPCVYTPNGHMLRQEVSSFALTMASWHNNRNN